MSKDIQRLRGTIDIYYEYAQQFVAVVDNCTKLAKLHGYKYIETPVIEPKSLFVSSVGESSDIVKKEFYNLNVQVQQFSELFESMKEDNKWIWDGYK